MWGRITGYVKSELTGWKNFDIMWLAAASCVILALSVYWKDNMIGIMSALTGVWCVIFTGKGKRTSFIFGTINVMLYAYIAFCAKYYGEVMLNLLYYFPLNFVGWFAWKKHMNEVTGEVVKEHLTGRKSLALYSCTAAGIIIYGIILKCLGGNLPFIDSMSTVVSVVAQILSIRRLTEQWILWIVVDIVTVIMWGVNFINGGESISTLIMWIIYLMNAIIMYIKWNREVKENAV